MSVLIINPYRFASGGGSPTNVALASVGASIITTSDYPGYDKALLIDGADSPEWYSFVTPVVTPQEQEITFASPKTLTGITAIGLASYKNTDWTFQTFDGTSWTTRDTVVGNILTNYNFTLPSPVAGCTKAKLRVTLSASYCVWQEIKIFGY